MFFPAGLAASDSLDDLQKSAVDWANVRAETIRLEGDWASQRELLVSTRDALRGRVQILEEKRDLLLAKTSSDPQRNLELAAKVKAARDEMDAADARLKDMTANLIRIRPWLPPRLSQALELPYRSLANPSLEMGERMEYVSAVINRCAQFNQGISCGEEVLSVNGDNDARVMQVIYWGMGQAYALDRSSGTAYVGFPGAKGWEWQSDPGITAAVSRLISVYQDKSDPQFVEIPVRLRDPASPPSNP